MKGRPETATDAGSTSEDPFHGSSDVQASKTHERISSTSMRICYLLEGTDLWGGVKVVFQQAEELQRRGIPVTVLAKGPRPDWYPLEAPFQQVREFSRETIPPSDFLIATFWKTVRPAVESARGAVIHFCQGYEGEYGHYWEIRHEIEEAYRLPTVKLTVSPHLNDLIREKFGQPAWCIGQTFDHTVFFPAPSVSFPKIPRIMLVGIYECDFKGIPAGLEALHRVRAAGMDFHLVRVSQFPMNPEERRFNFKGSFHVNVPADRMGDLYRSCHLALCPSTEAEGFGLPALEGLACGLPSVLTKISSFRGLWPGQDEYALFASPGSPEELADGILRLLTDSELRDGLRIRARQVALRYSTQETVSRLLSVLERAHRLDS